MFWKDVRLSYFECGQPNQNALHFHLDKRRNEAQRNGGKTQMQELNLVSELGKVHKL